MIECNDGCECIDTPLCGASRLHDTACDWLVARKSDCTIVEINYDGSPALYELKRHLLRHGVLSRAITTNSKAWNAYSDVSFSGRRMGDCPTGIADAVICTTVIKNKTIFKNTLLSYASLLKPDGRIFFRTDCFNEKLPYSWEKQSPPDEWYYNYSEVSMNKREATRHANECNPILDNECKHGENIPSMHYRRGMKYECNKNRKRKPVILHFPTIPESMKIKNLVSTKMACDCTDINLGIEYLNACKMLAEKDGKRVIIEVGCANGTELGYMRRHLHWHGVDATAIGIDVFMSDPAVDIFIESDVLDVSIGKVADVVILANMHTVFGNGDYESFRDAFIKSASFLKSDGMMIASHIEFIRGYKIARFKYVTRLMSKTEACEHALSCYDDNVKKCIHGVIVN